MKDRTKDREQKKERWNERENQREREKRKKRAKRDRKNRGRKNSVWNNERKTEFERELATRQQETHFQIYINASLTETPNCKINTIFPLRPFDKETKKIEDFLNEISKTSQIYYRNSISHTLGVHMWCRVQWISNYLILTLVNIKGVHFDDISH